MDELESGFGGGGESTVVFDSDENAFGGGIFSAAFEDFDGPGEGLCGGDAFGDGAAENTDVCGAELLGYVGPLFEFFVFGLAQIESGLREVNPDGDAVETDGVLVSGAAERGEVSIGGVGEPVDGGVESVEPEVGDVADEGFVGQGFGFELFAKGVSDEAGPHAGLGCCGGTNLGGGADGRDAL